MHCVTDHIKFSCAPVMFRGLLLEFHWNFKHRQPAAWRIPDFLTPSAARTLSALVGVPYAMRQKKPPDEGKTGFKARAVSAHLDLDDHGKRIFATCRGYLASDKRTEGDTRFKAHIPQTECLFISRATRGQPLELHLGRDSFVSVQKDYGYVGAGHK